MTDAFLIAFKTMVQLLGFMAVGYGLNKLRIIPKEAGQAVSKLVTSVFLPCLLLYTGIVECKVEYLGDYALLVLVGAAICLVTLVLSFPTAKLFGGKNDYLRGVYRYAMVVPNCSAVGTPLVLAFFGTEGLFQYNMFIFVLILVAYSWGILQLLPAGGKETFGQSLKRLLNPQFFAIVIGMILGALGGKNWIPAPVLGVVKDLNSCYSPIALLMAGFTLANYPIGKVFRDKKAYLFTLWRLMALPCIFLAVLLLFKAPLEIATWTALCYAGPCGVNVVIFPAAYGEDCRPGAGMILVSTLVSAVSIPLIYAVVQMLFA